MVDEVAPAESDEEMGRRLFFEEIQRMNERGQATSALVAAAALDDFLDKAIRSLMPNLDKELRAKLFDGYGPLSTFSGKIDMAYALGLIDRSVHKDIHIVRAIRNEFAHPNGAKIVTFSDPVFDRLFSKWPDYRKNIDKGMFLQVKFRGILEAMKEAIFRGAHAFPRDAN